VRNAFIQTMIAEARKNPKVALLMAEVGFSVVEPFEKEFPERFYNVGIAEQNLILTAAGMALKGMRPVAYSMSCFLGSRGFEMIKDSVCYQNLPVILVGIGTGLSYGSMGATHHATEESAIMRVLPNMKVLFPCDANQLSAALSYALTQQSPYYISIPKLPDISEKAPEPYMEGKAITYRKGQDGAIFAVGVGVATACQVADTLRKENIFVSVYGIHTVKPLDKEAILEGAKTKNVFVLDEHQYCAGIGGEIARILLENNQKINCFHDFSIRDSFANQVLAYPEYMEEYGLSADKISSTIKYMISGERE
jgi:transketolase